MMMYAFSTMTAGCVSAGWHRYGMNWRIMMIVGSLVRLGLVGRLRNAQDNRTMSASRR